MGFELRCDVGLGEFIMGRVRNSTEVIVVSPWLSPEVARELVELNRHAKVTVITTDDSNNAKAINEFYTVEYIKDTASAERELEEKELEELTMKRKRASKIMGIGLSLLVSSFAIATITPLGVLIIFIGIIIGFALILKGANEYDLIQNNIRNIALRIARMSSNTVREVYVPRVSRLVVLDKNAVKLHAKLVVLPNEGLVGIGSANLTSSGLQSNAECWVWLSSPEAVKETMDFVGWLLNQPRSNVAKTVVENRGWAITINDFLHNNKDSA
jgi:phosphatidylserine/phosphatidylglycerophosphate/cardiolipin synthase-like enzyme